MSIKDRDPMRRKQAVQCKIDSPEKPISEHEHVSEGKGADLADKAVIAEKAASSVVDYDISVGARAFALARVERLPISPEARAAARDFEMAPRYFPPAPVVEQEIGR